MKNKYFIVIIFSLFFGLFGGVSGVILGQNYIFEKLYKIPFYGDIDVGQINHRSGLIIKEAKNVVVEQDVKINEIMNSVGNSIVGVFKKNDLRVDEKNDKLNLKSTQEKIDINDYHYLQSNIAQGFVLTSDGWIISNLSDDRFLKLRDQKNSDISTTTIKKISDDYFIITNNKKLYEIDDIFIDSEINDYVFLHINVKDLSVIPFADIDNIKNGELLIATSWEKWTWLTSVFDFKKNNEFIRNSDLILKGISFNNFNETKINSFVFNLKGELVAFINNKKEIRLVDDFSDKINYFSKNKVIKKASLGVNYINLESLISTKEKKQKGALIYKNSKGVAIEKNSVAEIIKLKEGDIILSINGIEVDIDNDLNEIISNYKVGDSVKIVYSRGGIENSIVVKFK
ncbi:PDZ domain-containing protein [Candidatus Parcubacteria bacterium]|nr:PDZ domain-containing protein [Candidatus Parcubacteria bacterium]